MHNYILEVFDREQYKDLGVEGKVVVDVGAGFGETAIYFLERGAKPVVAFEPCPNMFREMLTNLALNGLLGRVVAINAGIGGEGAHRTLLCPRPTRAPLMLFDRVLRSLPRDVVVKVDVEEAEAEALAPSRAWRERRSWP